MQEHSTAGIHASGDEPHQPHKNQLPHHVTYVHTEHQPQKYLHTALTIVQVSSEAQATYGTPDVVGEIGAAMTDLPETSGGQDFSSTSSEVEQDFDDNIEVGEDFTMGLSIVIVVVEG